MEKTRIVTEIFLEKPNFEDVSRVASSLEQSGIKVIKLPMEDLGINTHLVIEKSDVGKANVILNKIGVSARELDVVIANLKNVPGTMADTAKKVSDKGVNLRYAFSVSVTSDLSYVLLSSDNNNAIIEALSS
ncbi:hypothetical protein KKF81_01245 [Candidatus Micrarchaeota archaeon]|nr:hypothetical protein [Candidatus Micrarchaeota archaeon]MBU1165546.1 hypothetical protein [Candidatus Micrarchaeota archaeon]MBU1886511.1 hypothetical protein [Candidatus Micrarchaeota archaeon]